MAIEALLDLESAKLIGKGLGAIGAGLAVGLGGVGTGVAQRVSVQQHSVQLLKTAVCLD